MSAPGLGGFRPKECPSNVQPAWEQGAASWPWLPLGFRSHGRIRDTLTDSLSCVHAHTHTHTDKYNRTYVHALFLLICMCCTHACIKARTHDFPYVCTGMTEHTTHAHIVFIHTHSDKYLPKNPQTLISTSFLAPHGELFPVFFLSFVILVLSQCQQPVICNALWKWQSHAAADIIHKQTYNKGRLPFIVSLRACLSAWPSLFFIYVLATFPKECWGPTNRIL